MNRNVSDGYREHYRFSRGNKRFGGRGKPNQGNHHFDGDYSKPGYTHKLKRARPPPGKAKHLQPGSDELSQHKQRNLHFGGEYSSRRYEYKKQKSSNKSIPPPVGSEEHSQLNIQETSKYLRKQFDEHPDGDIVLPAKVQDNEPQTSSEATNKSQQQQKQNTKSSSRKTVSGNLTGPEIYRLIQEGIANLSPQMKQNLINQGSHSYDAAIQLIQRQKRSALSREICDMASNKVHPRNCKVLNEIIPDAVANLESMPQEEIAKLSNTLNIDLDHGFEVDESFAADESIRSNDLHTAYMDRHIKSELCYETNSRDSSYRENYNNSNSFAEDTPENNFSNHFNQEYFPVSQPQLNPSPNEPSPQRNICFNNFELNSPHNEYHNEPLHRPPMIDFASAPSVYVPPQPVPEPMIAQPPPPPQLADMSALFTQQPDEVRIVKSEIWDNCTSDTPDSPNQSQVPQQRQDNSISNDYSSRTNELSNVNKSVLSNDNNYQSRYSGSSSRNQSQQSHSDMQNGAPKKAEVWNRIVVMGDSLKRNRTSVPCTQFVEDYRHNFSSNNFQRHSSHSHRSRPSKRHRYDDYTPPSKSPPNRSLITLDTNTTSDLHKDKYRDKNSNMDIANHVRDTDSFFTRTIISNDAVLDYDDAVARKDEDCGGDMTPSFTNETTSLDNEENDNSIPSDINVNEEYSMNTIQDTETAKNPPEDVVQETLTPASQGLKHSEFNSKGASIKVIQATDEAGTYKTIKADEITQHDDIFIEEKASDGQVVESVVRSMNITSMIDEEVIPGVQNEVIEDKSDKQETEITTQCSEVTLPVSNKVRRKRSHFRLYPPELPKKKLVRKSKNAVVNKAKLLRQSKDACPNCSNRLNTEPAIETDPEDTLRQYEKLKRQTHQMAIQWQSFERKLDDLLAERKQIRDWFSTILENNSPATKYYFDATHSEPTDPIMNKELIPEEIFMAVDTPEIVRTMSLVNKVSQMEIDVSINIDETNASQETDASKLLNNVLEFEQQEVTEKTPVVELIKYNMKELEAMRDDVCNSKQPDEVVVIEEECEEIEISETEERIETSEIIVEEIIELSDTVQNIVPLNEAYDFIGWQSTILVVKVIQGIVLAGDERGLLYYFDITNGEVMYSTELCTDAITCICVWPVSSNQVFIGSLDGNLCIVNIDERKCVKTIPVSAPIQCIETLWDIVFLGSRKGELIKYDIKQNKLFNPIGISNHAILAIKANLEGARRVLLTATRDSSVTVRDARTGLLLRTISGSISHPTIYSLLYHKNRIYCGTSADDVLVYGFQDGRRILKHEEPNGSGVTCMTMIEDLLFVGCYSSHIYVYNTVNNTCIATLRGPPGLLSCMDVTRNQIITGTTKHFQSLPLPPSVLELL